MKYFGALSEYILLARCDSILLREGTAPSRFDINTPLCTHTVWWAALTETAFRSGTGHAIMRDMRLILVYQPSKESKYTLILCLKNNEGLYKWTNSYLSATKMVPRVIVLLSTCILCAFPVMGDTSSTGACLNDDRWTDGLRTDFSTSGFPHPILAPNGSSRYCRCRTDGPWSLSDTWRVSTLWLL